MKRNIKQSISGFIFLITAVFSSGCGQSIVNNPAKSFDPQGSLLYSDYKDIYMLDFKTGKTEVLSSDETSHIEFSITNNSIYYRGSKFEKPDLLDIYRIDMDGSNLEQITFSGAVSCLSGTSNGKYLTYVEGKTSETSKLFIYDLLNKTKTRIGNAIYCPAWSPDGEKLAFFEASENSFFAKLLLYSVENEKTTDISLSADIINGVSWSYDGRKMIFKTGDSQKTSVNILDLGNKKTTQYEGLISGNYFSWSPNYDMISYRDNSAFHLTTLENLEDEKVINAHETTIKTWLYPSVWSPDGRYFAYLTAYEPPEGVTLSIYNVFGEDSMEIEIPGNWTTSVYWIYP